jgi:PAS domain S-box-containing protein
MQNDMAKLPKLLALPKTFQKLSRRDVLTIVGIALTYFFAHQIAFFFPDSEKVIMLIWPAGGIGMAAFLLNPRRLWPALTLAFYVSGVMADVILANRSFLTGMGYMTGNMVESIGCAWLVLHYAKEFRNFGQVKEVLALIVGTIFVNALSSCIGAGTSVLTRGAPFVDSWASWYISDGLGVLVVCPFIIAWLGVRKDFSNLSLKKLVEGVGFVAVWSLTNYAVFWGFNFETGLAFPPYLLVGLFAWPALRLGQPGVSLAILLVFTIAVVSPSIAIGPSPWGLEKTNLTHRLLELQLFMGFLAALGFLLAASFADRLRAEADLRENEAKFRGITSQTPDHILVQDRNLRYTLVVNPQLGLTEADMLGKTDQEFLEAADAEKLNAIKQTILKTGEAYHMEAALINRKGATEYFDGNYIPKFDSLGQVDGLIGYFRNVTERKRFEEQLVLARNDAEAANRAKSEFLANMSHEIRTPMTAIMGFSDLLMMSPKASPSEQSIFLEGIRKNGDSLLRLIDDILDLSRIEADRLSIEKAECAIQQIIDDVLSAVHVQAQQKGLRLNLNYQFPLPLTIFTDHARLRQVLVNLVGNAVKFTDQGEVCLTVRCQRETQDAGRIQFSVSDTGIGIPKDMIQRLFEPFMQVDSSSTRRYGGTGLGLGISKRLAKALGGDIEVESELGKGSSFTLTIDAGPLKEMIMVQSPDADCARNGSSHEASFAGLCGRVLLAEDYLDARKLVGYFLKDMKLEVDMADDGRMACDMAEKSKAEGRPYDLILMDIQMPIMDGFKATAWLRQHDWKGHIVAMTAYAMIGDREKCLAAGCDDYITKPVIPQALNELILHYLPKPVDKSDH